MVDRRSWRVCGKPPCTCVGGVADGVNVEDRLIKTVEGEGVFLAQSRNGHIPPMQKFLEKRSDRQKRTDQNRKFLKIKYKNLFPQIRRTLP
jgi:hypothetical protein